MTGRAALGIVLVLHLLTGCAARFSSQKITAVPPHCIALDEEHRIWAGVAEGSGVLAGGAGLSAIPFKDEDVRLGLAIGAAVSGAFAAASVKISSDAAQSYVKECQ